MNGNELEHLERPAVVITPLAFVIVLQRNGAGATAPFLVCFRIACQIFRQIQWVILRLTAFYRSKCFAKCVCFFGCDFEIPMITVKGDITENSRDIEIHCVLNEKMLSLNVVDLKSVFWQRCAIVVICF